MNIKEIISILAGIVILFIGVAEVACASSTGKIVFARANDIWIMGDDGTNKIKLTNSTDAEASPSFSPVGSKIA